MIFNSATQVIESGASELLDIGTMETQGSGFLKKYISRIPLPNYQWKYLVGVPVQGTEAEQFIIDKDGNFFGDYTVDTDTYDFVFSENEIVLTLPGAVFTSGIPYWVFIFTI